jgi:hypothetical protein
MQVKPKKNYEKPKLTKIRLDAKCAVLSLCKTSGKIGPSVPNCNAGVPCSGPGS